VFPKSVLIIDGSFSERTLLAARNLVGVRLLRSDDVTAEDLLHSRKLIITKSGLTGIVKRANP